MTNWTHVQAALTRAGYSCGATDGQPGPRTWTALFAYAAGRQPDAILTAIGAAAAKSLVNDAIAQTSARLAEFVAQTAHETGGYSQFEERFFYTAAKLVKQWPLHFTVQQAEASVGKPVEIASRAYGGRNGNARYPSQDGYTYRGRGMLQLTGRDAYAAYGPVVGLDLIEHPDLAADPADSLVIAIAFWTRARVNSCCDRGDYRGARGLTNCGTATPKVDPIGLADVATRRAALLKVLG